MTGTPQLRKLSDVRLREAWLTCADDGMVLVPTGDAYAAADEASSPSAWFIAFRCPKHDDETLRLWRPEPALTRFRTFSRNPASSSAPEGERPEVKP